MSVLFFELGAWEWRRREQPRALRRQTGSILTTILLNSDLLLTLIAGCVSVLYISQISSEIYRQWNAGHLTFPGRIIAIFIVYFMYLLIKQPFLRLQAIFSPRLAPLKASYTALGSAVKIDLGLGSDLGFSLPYSQLQEVRLMTPVQARQYLDLDIDPEFREAFKSRQELQDFMSGVRMRPKAFLVGVNSDQGTVVLLRGEDFLYMLNFDGQNGEDLLTAFEAFQDSRAVSPTP